jgi:hypothetical protein
MLFAVAFLVCGLAVVPGQVRAAATTYYVAPTGNDSNPGTQALPWKTIQKAANTLAAGDTVIVAAGTYPERVQVTRSGAAGAPITFRANGSVTMKGFTILANYVTVQGFYITDTPDHWRDGIGIFVQGSYNLVENNEVYYATRGGIIVFADPEDSTQSTNNVIRNNRLNRNAMNGVEVAGRNNLVEGNEIWATIQHHPKWANQPNWVDADGIRFFGSGHTIRRNYIHDITYTVPENVNPHIDCFQTWGPAYNIVFEQNRCKNLEAHALGEEG